MILLLSKSRNEIATDRLIPYLDKYNGNYFRINGADLLQKPIYFDIGNCIKINRLLVTFSGFWLIFGYG